MTFLEILKAKGFTQKSLCKHLESKNCYKYQQQVSEWCRGVRMPDLLCVYHLSKILDISIDDLTISILEGCKVI